jgi:single-strand DNA-binding protein
MQLSNFVQLVGHFGADPANKAMDTKKPFVTFSFATNYQYTDKEGKFVKETAWHSCVAFGKTAEIIMNYMKSGSHALIHGSLAYRTYDDHEGRTRYVTEIKVESIQFLSHKAE